MTNVAIGAPALAGRKLNPRAKPNPGPYPTLMRRAVGGWGAHQNLSPVRGLHHTQAIHDGPDVWPTAKVLHDERHERAILHRYRGAGVARGPTAGVQARTGPTPGHHRAPRTHQWRKRAGFRCACVALTCGVRRPPHRQRTRISIQTSRGRGANGLAATPRETQRHHVRMRKVPERAAWRPLRTAAWEWARRMAPISRRALLEDH